MGAGAVLILAATADALTALDPRDGIVLSLEHATDVIHQCSRSSPGSVEGSWLPAEREIRDLEARLPQALNDALAKSGRPAERSRDIGRQYAGLRVAGRKIIYVNGFPLSMIQTEARNTPRPSRDGWKTRAVMVCDGGPAFFGVEYDPKTRTFSNFAFNGIA